MGLCEVMCVCLMPVCAQVYTGVCAPGRSEEHTSEGDVVISSLTLLHIIMVVVVVVTEARFLHSA